jgi:prepilin peptidase CpaA
MALLAAAALFDACKFVIPNWISLALVGLFVGAGLVYPPGIDWLSHLGAMGLVLLGTLLLYRFRFLGGGDLKLLVAAGLWAGLGQLPQLLIWTAIAGGVFALGLIVLRRLLTGALVAQSAFEQVALPRFLLPGEQIPYGVAIAAGGIWLARDLPLLHLFL